MIKCHCKSLIVLMMFSSSLLAQSNNTAPLDETRPPVSTLIAVLTSSLESRSATAGQKFTLRAISDVVVDGQLVLPKGSRVLGHVTEAVSKSKDQPQSELWIVIEKAVRRDGSEVPLQAIIAALHAPQNSNSLSDDPTYGMMHSQEPAQVGATAAAASKASSSAAVATADFKGGVDERSALDENSRGAIGYKDLSLAWHLMVPPRSPLLPAMGKM